eukprot:g16161.t1
MLRLVLEEGEGPTEDLAELATSVLRHCPASCGQVEGGGFNVFAMAIALLRRLQPKEEIQLFLLQLLDDCRYSCQARKSVAAELKAKRMKALYVIEAALSTFCGPEGFDLGSTLLDEWLRPAMERSVGRRGSGCDEPPKSGDDVGGTGARRVGRGGPGRKLRRRLRALRRGGFHALDDAEASPHTGVLE